MNRRRVKKIMCVCVWKASKKQQEKMQTHNGTQTMNDTQRRERRKKYERMERKSDFNNKFLTLLLLFSSAFLCIPIIFFHSLPSSVREHSCSQKGLNR